MDWQTRKISPEQAAEKIKSEQRVFLTGNCSTPQKFLSALRQRYHELYDVELVQVLDLGPGDYVAPDMAEHVRINSLFVSRNVRQAVNDGLADFTPVFLSD